MTLLVRAARSREFVLQACDRSMAALDPKTLEPMPHPEPPPPVPKVWQVSDWALVSAGGCAVRGEYLRSLLNKPGRLDRDADIDSCIEALANVNATMSRNPVSRWTHADGTTSRAGGSFEVHMSGFSKTGRADYLRLFSGFPEERGSLDIAFHVSPPAVASDVEQFTLTRWLANPLWDFDLAFALEHVQRVHRFFRDKHPHEHLVTEELDITILRWDPKQSRPSLDKRIAG